MLLQFFIALVFAHNDWLEFTLESYISDVMFLFAPFCGWVITAKYAPQLTHRRLLLSGSIIFVSLLLAWYGFSFVSRYLNFGYCIGVFLYYCIVVFHLRMAKSRTVRYLLYYCGFSVVLLSIVIGTVLYFVPALIIAVTRSDFTDKYRVVSSYGTYRLEKYTRSTISNTYTQFAVFKSTIPYVLERKLAASPSINIYEVPVCS